MNKRTPLYEQHQHAGAQFVDFSGWYMPLHYGSQIEEHQSVRRAAGVFDVSHMGVVDLTGEGVKAYLRYVLANDVAKLTVPGTALYSCMLNEEGGIIDDLIVYYRADDHYRMVLNAATCDKDVQWLEQLAARYSVNVKKCNDLSIIALQGPEAIRQLMSIVTPSLADQIGQLRPFEFLIDQDIMIAYTGYTGEAGVEIILSNEKVFGWWQSLLNAGARPCGLAARDTLRLEAGFNLYGMDMNENTSPLISNLSWTVSFEDILRDFIGRSSLEKEKERGILQKLVGLAMEAPGVLRHHQRVFVEPCDEGSVTSGSFSPTLGHAIALARVPIETGSTAVVERRGKCIAVKVVKPPFIKKRGR